MGRRPLGVFGGGERKETGDKIQKVNLIFADGAVAQSQGFQPGVQGWIIRSDGSVEIQGTLTVGDAATVESLAVTSAINMQRSTDAKINFGTLTSADSMELLYNDAGNFGGLSWVNTAVEYASIKADADTSILTIGGTKTLLDATTVEATNGMSLLGNLDMNGLDLDDVGIANIDNLDLISQGTNPAASDGPDDYADGFTLNILSSATGWPITTGHVETFIFDTSRARQVAYGKEGGTTYERFWASSTTWGNWRVVTPIFEGAQFSDKAVSGTGWEDVGTLTIAVPSSNFACHVEAHGSGNARNITTVTQTVQLRIGISIDGGSTWAYNYSNVGTLVSDENYSPLACNGYLEGATPSGNVVVKLQTALSGGSTNELERGVLTATVHNGV